MRKIINNHVFDSDKARQVGSEWDNGCYGSYNSLEETLYCKHNGEYFVYGKGGPNTRYAVRTDGNMFTTGENITPLTVEDARTWAEKHLDADEYESEFTVDDDDDEKRQKMFYLAGSTIDKIAIAAQEQCVSQSDIITELVNTL